MSSMANIDNLANMPGGNLVMPAWAPGLMGFAVAAMMYGVTVGQSIYYAWCFPNDSKYLKLLVLVIFIADTAHLVGSIQLYWFMLISCHRDYSPSCKDGLAWGLVDFMCLDFVITFIVQGFYCHRLWIISQKNKYVTGLILFAAVLGLAIGTWFCVTSIMGGTSSAVFTNPLILPVASTNTLCDFLITGAVVKYIWSSGNRWNQRTTVQDLAVILVNMGAFTCSISVILGTVYLAQGNGYWVSAVGIVISRSYVNSMLAVLNARRRIRDRTAVMTFKLGSTVYSFS